MKRLRVPFALLFAALLVAVVAGFTTRQSGNSAVAPASGAAALQKTFVDVYQRVSPSVVQIQTAAGLGSGIVFDTKGDIVTNNHVVEGDTAFTVTTAGGKQLKATLVGTFPNDDLAVIRVPSGSGLRPAAFAQSSKLQVGQIAMAIGNPLGLQSSVTQGIVSALNRQAPEGNGFTLQNAIQTSAPINPGNSGGALVDIQGRVIGIPTLAAADAQLGGAASGIGFAIPSDTVKDIAAQIVQNGKVVNSHRAYLGIKIGDTGSGVYVGTVEAGGPAAKAGLSVGDVITALNGKPTPTSVELGQVLASLKPGQTAQLKVTHQDRSTATVDVTLGELPAN